MNKESQEMLSRYLNRLDLAREELNRPDEDVMTMAVCHQVREIISGLMQGWLQMRGAESKSVETLEQLRERCAALDARFSNLELTSMICHPARISGEQSYCMDQDHIRKCLTVAEQCEAIVRVAVG